ncbi:hypothetical protein JW707_01125 [Candidatus Woesearchaeota archaeon]|nr:hypothetical protein [Candidatus Woesearchaeota archaeon]
MDSHREGADDFVYYQFNLQPEAGLHLVEVVISNEKESKSFKYFDADYNEVDIWGSPLPDSIFLSQEDFFEQSQGSAKLQGKTLVITKDAFEANSRREDSKNATEFFNGADLTVFFIFKEGTAKVQYKFAHKEIMRAPFFSLSS